MAAAACRSARFLLGFLIIHIGLDELNGLDIDLDKGVDFCIFAAINPVGNLHFGHGNKLTVAVEHIG
jgi:hypothetical protein